MDENYCSNNPATLLMINHSKQSLKHESATMVDDTRDRVIRLEEKVTNLTNECEKTFPKIDHLYSMVLQGKGAARVLQYGSYGAVGLIGYLLSKFPLLTAWLAGLPR